MISQQELEALREVALQAMPETAKVYRISEEDDGSLGTITVESIIATVPCRIDAQRSQVTEVVVGGTVQSTGTHLVRLPYHTDITSSDKIKVGTRSFEVLGVTRTSYGTSMTAQCKEVR